MIQARDAFYSGLDKGDPCHWRDVGPDEIWAAAWRAAWNLRQQVPEGWRELLENIATVGSEPLNSAVVYRDLASRRHFMAELRDKARALLAAAPKPEDVK